MLKRKIGATDTETGVMILGGHGLLPFLGKPAPDYKEAVRFFHYLHEHGLTHFDATWSSERKIFAQLLKDTKTQDSLLPMLWHMDHGREENSIDDFIENLRHELDELSCQQAECIFLTQQWCEKKPWAFDGLQKAKELQLTRSVGFGVMAGARLGEEFFYDTHHHWDILAPYWNYSLRRQQFLIEFAREQNIGVYSLGAFGRGAILQWPGVNPAEFVRPWLKWILREPSVFAFSLSVSSLDEASMAVDACDDRKMSPEEVLYLHRMNFPIQHVDYQIRDGEATLQSFEVFHPETHNSNMISKNMIRWKSL